MKISRAVEPGLIVEVGDVDDERVSFPMARESPIQKSITGRIGMWLPSMDSQTMDVDVFMSMHQVADRRTARFETETACRSGAARQACSISLPDPAVARFSKFSFFLASAQS